ncbi:MAG TPA: SIS domain-containing protein [Acidimicrobiia bacterium]|nr:SIS domain-containing protein [Acidimicrobiia bacterium]
MTTDTPDLGRVYPFSPSQRGTSREHRNLRHELARSTRAKFAESETVRADTLEVQRAQIVACAIALAEAVAAGSTIFTFGNGSCSTDASELALLFSTRAPEPRLSACAAVALTDDTAALSALAEDVGYERAIAQQLEALGEHGDIAIGFCSAAPPRNVVAAYRTARRLGMLSVGFCGPSRAGDDDVVVDHRIGVDSTSVYRVEEAHTALYHVLWELVGLARSLTMP